MDERCPKELRRNKLALGLLRRNVRTTTICLWTGLTRARVDNLRKAHTYEFPSFTLMRPSGPSPHKLREFLRSPRMRSEAAALGGLCRAFGVIPPRAMPDARRYLPSLSRGEQICHVHDLYRDLVPSATMTVEQLIFLLMALAGGDSHDIAQCSNCHGAILIDPLGSSRRVCMHCLQDAKHRGIQAVEPAADPVACDDIGTPHHGQVPLFDLIDTRPGTPRLESSTGKAD